MASATATADFERIYRRHARDVYRFALSVVRNPLEAEDVTQTTFLNAYRALARGDRPDRPRSWLFAIAHNAIRSRDRWRLRRPPEVSLDVAEYRLAASSDESPAVDDLLRALSDLPEAQREALALRELQGQTYPEIAELLGVSVSAVESLIGRARRALRAQRERLAGIAIFRRLCEQGDGGAAGVAAKVSVVAAAAAAVAGGMAVETHVAGPTPTPAVVAKPSPPAEPLVASVAKPAAAVHVRTSAAVSRAAAPAAGPVPPPSSGSASAPTAVVDPPAGATTAAPQASPTATVPESATTAVAAAAATTSSAVTDAATTAVAATATTVAAAVPSTPAVTAPTVSTPPVPSPPVTTPPLPTPTVTLPPLPAPPTVPLP